MASVTLVTLGLKSMQVLGVYIPVGSWGFTMLRG